jgi:hypothetical protein
MANPASQASSFVPDPKYTFLFTFNREDNALTCVICADSHLILPWPGEAVKDNDPSLLPCGHIFGTKCLEIWLQTHDTCPTCRFRLKYELCEHSIPARRLTRENVMFIPRTIPDGGAVGDQCAECRARTGQRVAAELCVHLARRYYECKGRYEERGLETDRRVTEEAKAELNKVVEVLRPGGDRTW